ncbi:Molybdopterin synthase catalytic subunit [Melia azedarach]|uniref:Molybdopterin synthase catalytic subunit n=1 Tax=Melia azedarach TaxID=155640 RepID=A0ACC1YM21_MELAZ|nr:Molybdopterin synthase catalytic subunit [Melia azedarach]
MNEEEKTLVEILEESNPIDLTKYITYVSAPQAGAIATFSGTTRDTFEVAHRLGTVPVGETSVFIAVSAVHRADALDACKFLIDELKASVPIWKKEVYSNGEIWKENSEFIERRLELGKKDGICSGREAQVKAHDTRTCCRAKVKVDDGEGIADTSTSK